MCAPRLLVLSSSFPRFDGDSAGHFVESEVRALVDQGHEVRVLALGAPPPPEKHALHPAPYGLKWLGGSALFDHPGAWPRLRENPLRLLTLWPCWRRAHRALQRAEEERVIAHWLFPWGLCAARENQTRQIRRELTVVAHGSDVRLIMKLPRLFAEQLLQDLARGSTQFRFVSRELQEELLSFHSKSELVRSKIERAQILPSPLHLPELPEREEARARLGLSPEAHLLLIVGRLIPEKRIETALRAGSLLPHAELVVLGAGPLEKELAREFPLARFLGQLPRPEALLWMRAADLLLCASRTEGAPTIVREARQLGTPVVTPEVGDLRLWARDDPEIWLISSSPGERH